VTLDEAGNDDSLWERAVQIDIDAFAAEFGGPEYEAYARRRFTAHRKLVEKAIGKWYLASVDGEFAGTLGIFKGDGFCRFQEISVAKDCQRQGIASTMTHEVARLTRKEWPTLTQVIVAESDGNAQRIYRALGFDPHSISQALQMKVKTS
jgi:ribosomal protein S18 acetylase RimI-like enzyme